MELLKVFLVGGAICAIVQIFMEKTKLMPGRIMVMLVCLGSLLGAIGLYKPFNEWAKAGASVPLIGFGNTLYEGVKESVDKEGFIGLFKGGLTNSAVGISAALIFGYIASLIFNPKVKN
ncbi:MAG: SpoVA/SpoVAEb family sporulation membrane protein [Lachnospiraceae bacterium]|nr:SpoVA/SpoVAEb family sporulation membrane protein [Lachnospiraceae bacterium]